MRRDHREKNGIFRGGRSQREQDDVVVNEMHASVSVRLSYDDRFEQFMKNEVEENKIEDLSLLPLTVQGCVHYIGSYRVF